MDKNIDEEKLSEKNYNFNLDYKLNKSKNIKKDLSRDSLITSDINKSIKNNKFNYMNSISDKSINKKIKKQIESNSLFSSQSSKNQIKKLNNSKQKNNNNNKDFDKIIVDNIDNIYLNVTKLPNKLFKQRIFLLIIAFYVSCIHWTFLFLTKRKMERDYCFTRLNQFEVCTPEQYCSQNVISQINYYIYNDSLITYNNSLNAHQNFLEEMNEINQYYKEFFLNYNYIISKNRLLLTKDLSKENLDNFNFVILLTKKEKWNIFLNYYSFCERDMYYFYITGMIITGGILGSFLFGILADIFGRKKIIIVTLFIVTLSLIIITILCFILEHKKNIFLEEYKKKNINSKNNINYAFLSNLFYQQKINNIFRTFSVKFLISIFFLNTALRPLFQISLSLLLENSSSDLNVLENYRRFIFISTALPPFILAILLIILNDFIYLFLFLSISFFILFIFSFFILNESLRHLYEYCEWKELTNKIINVFNITENNSINFKNKNEFEAFQLEENEKMYKNMFKGSNHLNNHIDYHTTKYEIIKKRIAAIRRDIRRNSDLIIKKSETKFNPYVIYACLSSNAYFMKSKYLFAILLFIIYIQEYFVKKELLEEPFFGLSDLYIDKHNNFIINSNFFILGIVIYISNYTYYFFYRISCFKIILFTSLIIITILFYLYHFIIYETDDFPVDLSQFNFKTFDISHIRNNNYNYKVYILLFFIQFFLNGITFYINILFIKLSKTMYRCTFFAFNNILFLVSMGFGDMIIFQIKHYFILVSSLNFVGIVVSIFLGEFRNIPFIINDLKQNKYNNKK